MIYLDFLDISVFLAVAGDTDDCRLLLASVISRYLDLSLHTFTGAAIVRSVVIFY